MDRAMAGLPGWLASLIVAGAAIIVALALHWLAVQIVRRASARSVSSIDDNLLLRLRQPSRWLFVAIALSLVQPALALDEGGLRLWTRLSGLLVPALIGWLAIAVLGVVFDIIQARADIDVADNLRARRRRTRSGILYRIAIFIVLLVTFCMMLMSIPSVRSIGVTLIASAGLAGLAVGAAAQPALKNLIAGIQMAFTEPIRIDDVVIIEGEWGRIEEIRLTYVVVKVWDERRLVVPVSKFLEDSFQNWTRQTSQLLGSVFWYLDPATDISRLREKVGEIINAHPLWDGRFWNMQVTDTKPEAMEVRALMTAADASKAFDLRCDVREGLLAFIRDTMPDALVQYRGRVAMVGGAGEGSPARGGPDRGGPDLGSSDTGGGTGGAGSIPATSTGEGAAV
ncbi:putative MscS family transporter [Sphingobium sp. SYK-6]|uniref:mechanosensitive ion channel family protein n=1 Tax=Sphingobium sp. (strain NBRC 103272 / SYK-6) TaxID=627192 RepID=UPI0002276EFD|nr:mechanosensitive ion channel domain-containing protein [Sphingobium sp. SYK-6]BAK66815.1 putative MscS family transporter [Sphingobium sp. SYK-6]